MPITAQSVIKRAVETIQDTTSIRWPVNELVRYLNDAQREIILYRPDAMNTTATMTLVAGSRQDLDNATLTLTPAKLIEITRNMAATSAKEALTLIDRKILDATTKGWHNQTGVVNILHYMYDPRDPKTFYVYPPATALAQLEVMYAAYPTDITEPADGVLFGAVTGNLTVPDIYGNAVLDYTLYRAYSKDADFAGNAARAQSHYAAFANSMGAEIKATVNVAPQVKAALVQK